ncbi:uncharacterized protein LOC116305368 [Actinia tenebrosa]|uniref:Uncharacterized protein LOC116305368 n=1 Tax=Actinia tenebrosa TaxID=6105 RepID=A0A6P8IUY1_ACTTE|nr:uncharacterized protein LOC116305368 [Actinia tenebrosa]
MGCGGSKEVPNLNNNNATVKVKPTVGDQENAEKRDDGNTNSMELNSIDSPSPIALTPDIHVKNNVSKPPFAGDKKVKRVENARESLVDSVSDGWSDSPAKQTHTHNVSDPHNENLMNLESELDSEYGKDGIDLTSRSFAVTGPNKSEVLDHGIQFEVTQRLTKKHSEEPFDPSSLVDIDKFKAVNVPQQANKSPDKEKTVAMDTKQERKRSISNGQVPQVPTEYNEYYDEDEKALMESIEQDFLGTAYSTLPGAVI